MLDQPDKLRQAAILVATLDAPIAEQLLARLDRDQAAKVRAAASRLADVSPEEREAALQSFTAGAGEPPPKPPVDSGVELDGSLAELLSKYDQAGQATASDNEGDANPDGPKFSASGPPMAESCADSSEAPSFDFLEQVDAQLLAPVLTTEQPQTVAVVLSCLSTKRAAELLGVLPEERQTEVLFRMSGLSPGDPASLHTLAAELRTWVETHQRDVQRREQGIATVRDILAHWSTEKNAAIHSRLQSRDAQLASRIATIREHDGDETATTDTPCEIHSASTVENSVETPKPDSPEMARPSLSDEVPPDLHTLSAAVSNAPTPDALFDSLVFLDDATWRRVLTCVESEVVALALTGANAELIDRIAACLPRSQSRWMKRSLRVVGPVRLADVAAARQELARIATAFAREETKLPASA